MVRTAVICFLMYVFSLSSGYVLLDDDNNFTEVLSLPSEYNIRAEKMDFLTDMKMPMELWYSTEYNRSRVDVYGGMVRRYFYWGEEGANGGDGIIYMTHPEWSEREGHMTFCVKVNMSDDYTAGAFPSEEPYIYAGKTWHEGRKVDEWKFTSDYEDSRWEQVLYSYRTERGEDVPVQIVQKAINIMLGSIDYHVIFNYDRFNPLFCEEDLDAGKEESCKWMQDDFNEHMKVLHPAFHTDLDAAFNSFKNHHQKKYKNMEEHNKRKENFRRNWQFVVDHNSQNLGFKLALNHLSDLTPAERAHMNGGRRSSEPSATLTLAFPHTENQVAEIVTQIPEEYDMRLEAIISPVKNQDVCGSCWAFGTTAAVEGALARLDGRLLDLSEQSLLDCSWEGGNNGCIGGFPKKALKHIMKHGMPLEEDYGGYLGEDGYCHLENATEVFKIRGFAMVTPLSVSAMKVALYKYGPVIVTMQASDTLMFYKSGVFYDRTCVDGGDINHVVAIVGYGTRDGVDYWIVKNSYGQEWGENGYILLSSFNNNCFVLDEPYYPVV